MAYTNTVRGWWKDYFKGGYDRRVVFLGRIEVKASSFTLDAWRALERALQVHGYGKAGIVSTYYPRLIAGTTKQSLHGYSGVALDIDPYSLGNPYVKGTRWDFSLTKFTRPQVEAVLAIRTVNGKSVWRWGGDFGDYMHWQLNCQPGDIETGIDWDTVANSIGGDDEVDDFIQAVFDEWSLDDVEDMRQRGFWSGESVYYKEPGAAPAWVDVKSLVTKCLAAGAVFASYEAAVSPDCACEDAVVELDADLTALEITVENLRTTLRGV